MNLNTQKRLINGTTAGFLALAVGSIAWSLGSIDSTPLASAVDQGRPKQADVAKPIGSQTISERTGKVDFSASMLSPLYDPPPPPPKKKVEVPPPVSKSPPPPPKPPRPRLDWTLVGTILDSDGNIAIVTDVSGKTDVRREGELVELEPGGVLVRKIDSDKVTFEVQGTESTLTLNKGFKSNGANSEKGNARRRNR